MSAAARPFYCNWCREEIGHMVEGEGFMPRLPQHMSEEQWFARVKGIKHDVLKLAAIPCPHCDGTVFAAVPERDSHP